MDYGLNYSERFEILFEDYIKIKIDFEYNSKFRILESLDKS